MNELKPVAKPFPVCQLDGEPGSRIHFDDHGTRILANHNICAQVTQVGHIITKRRQLEDSLPIRNLLSLTKGFPSQDGFR